MKIACIQPRAMGLNQCVENAGNIFRLIAGAAAKGAEFIILPEACYPAYFIGTDPELCFETLKGTKAFLEKTTELAKNFAVHIAVGYMEERDGQIYNCASVFDDDGRCIHTCEKSNMWHMDAAWTTPGKCFSTFETKFGCLGMLICADGRIPEICRILALQGAKAVIDPVNLVASAASQKALTNQQYAFMLPTRAMENKVWLFAANKTGGEANAMVYLGRSMIIAPDGEIVAEAEPDEECIVYYDADLDAGPGSLDERRPELYGTLVSPTEELPAYVALTSSVNNIADCERYMCTSQFSARNCDEYLKKALNNICAAKLHFADMLLFPSLGEDMDIRAVHTKLSRSLPDGMLAVLPGTERGVRTALVFSKHSILGSFEKTHGKKAGRNGFREPVDTPLGRIAVVFDREMYIPEIARVYALLGTDLLLWADVETRRQSAGLARTRAAENKIFTARSSSAVEGESSLIVNPDGAVLGAALNGTEQLVGAMIFAPLSRAKTVVPGTNIITGRFGNAYSKLVEK